MTRSWDIRKTELLLLFTTRNNHNLFDDIKSLFRNVQWFQNYAGFLMDEISPLGHTVKSLYAWRLKSLNQELFNKLRISRPLQTKLIFRITNFECTCYFRMRRLSVWSQELSDFFTNFWLYYIYTWWSCSLYHNCVYSIFPVLLLLPSFNRLTRFDHLSVRVYEVHISYSYITLHFQFAMTS